MLLGKGYHRLYGRVASTGGGLPERLSLVALDPGTLQAPERGTATGDAGLDIFGERPALFGDFFTEGLAMTAAEAILAGRPVVTNPVVPALEVLRSACVEAKTDDAESHLEAVLKLATDADLYRSVCAACFQYQEQFYDRKYGLAQSLKTALGPYL